ncbi:MAG TPA: serine/threonine-protein kinase [Steroidobacteraceae bacterium]|nr:serine/threonine-protein kinase [Steroidobacteraceae bacterium]
MSAAHWGEVKALFSAAMELPREDRDAYLALEAGGNPALLAEVQSLLDSHEQPGKFLDTVTHEFRSQALAASGPARGRIGERIGAYRIVGVLGTGGMGDVFKAVRDDDQYRAEVAIKLMRADVRSSLTEQRFKTERQILAGLDHRNVARLLDGGTTDGGMPYVVMELVSGQPIDADCDARKLGVRDRVQLFLQVCAAVSYAHQHLVVHRDLKPNNILVTADGSVKLLDFGIAKLLEAEADTALAVADATATTLRAMTLEYASPEQVSGSPVTTVSDVYSLGVVLYQLLTGKSPYGVRTNDAARMAEILSDSMPTRPSQVDRKVDADLDNILLMALRKEPQRRYASVEQLANDLRNYLTGMPVFARGNSWRYRTAKFVRRRRVELAAGVFVGFALLGALMFSMREARIAERERLVAQQHFASVRKLANTMLFQLHDEMARVTGSVKTRELLVKTSLEYLDELYQASNSDRALQEELANAYIRVASIQGSDTEANRGNFAGALDSYARAIALLTPLTAADPANSHAGWALAHAFTEQAALLMVVRGPKFARDSAKEGVALTEAFAPKIPDEAQRLARFVNAYVTEARILGFMGLPLEAMDSLEKLINAGETYWYAHPDDERAFQALSTAYTNAAHIDDPRLIGDAAIDERAFALLRKRMWADEKLVALKPNEVEYQNRLAGTRYNIGIRLASRGKFAQALELFEQAVPVAAKAAALDPDDVRAQYALALHQTRLAQALFETGSVEKARALYLESGSSLERVFERDNSLRTEYAIGVNAVRLGELYAYLAKRSRAGRSARLDLWRQARDSLQRGVASLQNVTASATLPSVDMVDVRDGVASLARVDATLAKLQEERATSR